MRSILAIISLVGLMVIGLLIYSMSTSVDEMEQTATNYKQGVTQQLSAKTKELAKPVLDKLGVDVNTVSADDLNVVKQKIEQASTAVNDATAQISGSK